MCLRLSSLGVENHTKGVAVPSPSFERPPPYCPSPSSVLPSSQKLYPSNFPTFSLHLYPPAQLRVLTHLVSISNPSITDGEKPRGRAQEEIENEQKHLQPNRLYRPITGYKLSQKKVKNNLGSVAVGRRRGWFLIIVIRQEPRNFTCIFCFLFSASGGWVGDVDLEIKNVLRIDSGQSRRAQFRIFSTRKDPRLSLSRGWLPAAFTKSELECRGGALHVPTNTLPDLSNDNIPSC
jgi:hypothetical protein